MSKIHDHKKGIYFFSCPGCGNVHWFSTTGFTPSQPDGDIVPRGPVWSFNGDMEKPTVRASLLVKGQFTCHSFITDGKIEYLGDCTHNLAGKTVEMEDFQW